MKILLLGASGMLGSTLGPFLVSEGYDIVTHSRGGDSHYHGNLSEPAVAFNLLNEVAPDCVVNLIGLADVDHCETEPKLAYLLNVRPVENIATWARKSGHSCHLIHISTDQVYDGSGPQAEDQITLTNYYAFSKYAGELVASGIPSTILRSNFIGRSRCEKRTSLTDWLFQSLSQGAPIKVFDDVLFSPVAMRTLSEMIDLCIRIRPIGIFNLGSEDGMSKAELAFAFAAKLRLPTDGMTRTTSDQAKSLKAYRPKDMRMNVKKFEQHMNLKLPSLDSQIDRIVGDYRETR